MHLTFIVECGTFSIYADETGAQVFIAHGPGFRRLTPFEDIDLVESWADYCHTHTRSRDCWLEMLRETVTDPEAVDDIVWCAQCEEPLHSNDGYSVDEGVACEPCYDSEYTTCTHCCCKFQETTTTLGNDEVCDGCRGNHYSFCDLCDGYYPDDYAYDHGHTDNDDSGCDCESPARNFTVRNDGEPPLANDERVTVTLPGGVISTEGMGEIARYLRDVSGAALYQEQRDGFYSLSHSLPTEVGNTWQTRQGNFTKRLSRYAYKTHNLKIPPDVVSRIGCIARDHSTAVDFHLEVTRDLNLSAADFGNDGSCWWESYEAGRCALKNNGGYGLRAFNGYDVSGRAWVLPLKLNDDVARLSPTFNTDADAFVVFNGYGTLSGYVAARIVAHMAGMTYRKITFSCSPMWVNGDSGYIIAPEDIAAPYTDGHLTLSVDTHSNLFEDERKELANVA